MEPVLTDPLFPIVIQMLNTPPNAVSSLTQQYYASMALACFVALFSVSALVAMIRLLAFHIRLGKKETMISCLLLMLPFDFLLIAFLNMTTIEFISHPMNRSYDDDNDTTDDEYDDDEYGDDDSEEDETDDNPWRRSSRTPKQEGHVMRVLNAWTHKTLRRLAGYRLIGGRTSLWRSIISPNHHSHHRSRRRRRGDRSVSSIVTPWAAGGRRKRRESPTTTRNDVDLEEILATRTIRPVVALDGPDYDDDMGLDMNILDEGYATALATKQYGDDDDGNHGKDDDDNIIINREVSVPLSSKAARLLDISDSETKLYQSSQSADTISID